MSRPLHEIRDVGSQAKALGYAVSRTGLGHLRCTHRTGALVFVSAGDPRAERSRGGDAQEVRSITSTTITFIIVSTTRSVNMTSSGNDNSVSIIPFIGDRGLSHDALADLERVAFETEGDPAIIFEPANLVTRTETELWCLAGMLARRGMMPHSCRRGKRRRTAQRLRGVPARASGPAAIMSTNGTLHLNWPNGRSEAGAAPAQRHVCHGRGVCPRGLQDRRHVTATIFAATVTAPSAAKRRADVDQGGGRRGRGGL